MNKNYKRFNLKIKLNKNNQYSNSHFLKKKKTINNLHVYYSILNHLTFFINFHSRICIDPKQDRQGGECIRVTCRSFLGMIKVPTTGDIYPRLVGEPGHLKASWGSRASQPVGSRHQPAITLAGLHGSELLRPSSAQCAACSLPAATITAKCIRFAATRAFPSSPLYTGIDARAPRARPDRVLTMGYDARSFALRGENATSDRSSKVEKGVVFIQ